LVFPANNAYLGSLAEKTWLNEQNASDTDGSKDGIEALIAGEQKPRRSVSDDAPTR